MNDWEAVQTGRIQALKLKLVPSSTGETLFGTLNAEFFEGKLPSLPVFAVAGLNHRTGSLGLYDSREKRILFDSKIGLTPPGRKLDVRDLRLVMLHEMAHAAVDFSPSSSHSRDRVGHGLPWQGVMLRILSLGEEKVFIDLAQTAWKDDDLRLIDRLLELPGRDRIADLAIIGAAAISSGKLTEADASAWVLGKART